MCVCVCVASVCVCIKYCRDPVWGHTGVGKNFMEEFFRVQTVFLIDKISRERLSRVEVETPSPPRLKTIHG